MEKIETMNNYELVGLLYGIQLFMLIFAVIALLCGEIGFSVAFVAVAVVSQALKAKIKRIMISDRKEHEKQATIKMTAIREDKRKAKENLFRDFA